MRDVPQLSSANVSLLFAMPPEICRAVVGATHAAFGVFKTMQGSDFDSLTAVYSLLQTHVIPRKVFNFIENAMTDTLNKSLKVIVLIALLSRQTL